MSVSGNDDTSSSDLQVDMDLGVDCAATPSILRRTSSQDEDAAPAPLKRRISWVDDKSNSNLETHFYLEEDQCESDSSPKRVVDEDDESVVKGLDETTKTIHKKSKAQAPKKKNQRKKTVNLSMKDSTPPLTAESTEDDDDDVPLVIDNNGDDTSLTIDKGDEEIVGMKNPEMAKSKAKTPKKYQTKKRANKSKKASTPPVAAESIEYDSEDVPLVIHDDSDNENMLMIDEGDDEMMEVKKDKKKKRTKLDVRAERMDYRRKKEEMLKALGNKVIKTEEEEEQELELLADIVYHDPFTGAMRRKEKKYTPKSREQVRKEISKALGNPTNSLASVRVEEVRVMENWKKEWKEGGGAQLDNVGATVKVEEGDVTEVKKSAKKVKAEILLDDMPDIDDLGHHFNDSSIIPQMKVDKRRLRESGVEEKKKGGRKKGVPHATPAKKRKEEDRPKTEAETIEEIEKKVADTVEKAARMKKQKMEDKARRKDEMEKKKEQEQKERDEKKRRKIEERELIKKKNDAKKSVTRWKPKSRAEAARRTRKLLATTSVTQKEEAEDEDEPKRKKRKYTRRSTCIQLTRRMKKEMAEEQETDENGIGYGTFVHNPRDVDIDELCTEWPLSDEGSDGEDDEELAPFLWTSPDDEMHEGAIGPHNFDPDESIKRHLNDVEKFSEGINVEYLEMTKQLDGMKLNVFSESTLTKFNPRIVHNIDDRSTIGTWPSDMCTKSHTYIPKFKSETWKFAEQRPFPGLIRIRPAHMKMHGDMAKYIDSISGGETVKVTDDDIEKNLDELLASKRRNDNSWKPLPSVRNPYDVPEKNTRNVSGNMKEHRRESYVERKVVKNLPSEVTTKKRKKTRKEALKGIKKPRLIVEETQTTYEAVKVEEEGGGEDGYQYAWDEMGEMPVDNPMRDDQLVDDPFAINPYQATDYCNEEVVMDGSHYSQEEHEETQLGGAFSFMATHLG